MTSKTTPGVKTVPRPGGTAGTGRRDPDWRRNRDWLAAVASIGTCVLCGKSGVQVSHRDEGRGIGEKTPDCWTAPLCPECHHENGNGKTLDKAARRAEMDRAIVLTLAELVQRGVLRVVK